jgi:uncharacterized protein
MRTGITQLPLHRGKAPAWLFQRMKRLSKEIVFFVIDTGGADELLYRVSDPFWFQALGCALGFDWHSSGVTTTVCGALKEAIRGMEKELGFYIAGGKGRASRKTPQEIMERCDQGPIDGARLVYASRMSAKVDSAALQDGYQIYHHSFFFTEKGSWAVVQQGMNEETRYARRYHWLSQGLADFVCEPHWAICCDRRNEGLNLVALESEEAREAITKTSRERPDFLVAEGKKVNSLYLPRQHAIPMEELRLERLEKAFVNVYERSPKNFEEVLGVPGVGPKSLRALTLISELLYGTKPSFKDPSRFSFAHGGKDGHPYPVDRAAYDKTIEVLQYAVERARVGDHEKIEAIRRLKDFNVKCQSPNTK